MWPRPGFLCLRVLQTTWTVLSSKTSSIFVIVSTFSAQVSSLSQAASSTPACSTGRWQIWSWFLYSSCLHTTASLSIGKLRLRLLNACGSCFLTLGDCGFNTQRPGGSERSLSQIQADPTRRAPPAPAASPLWDRFHAIGFDPTGPFSQATTIRYFYRDYDRRLRAVHAILLAPGPAAVSDHLGSIRLRNLSRMLVVGRLHAVPYLRTPAQQVRYLEQQAEVLDLLSAELQRRKEALVPPARRRASIELRFTPFWSLSLLDAMPLAQLLHAPDLLRLLPHPLADSVSLVLAPKYPDPLIRKWCNLRGTFDGSELSCDDLRAYSQAHPCPCSRVPSAFRFRAWR